MKFFKELFCGHVFEITNDTQRAVKYYTDGMNAFDLDDYKEYHIEVKCIKCGKEKFERKVERLT